MIDYIIENADIIHAYTQDSFSWEHANVIEARNESIDFDDICNQIDQFLSRDKVAKYFIEDPYKGFIAELLWGGKYAGRNAKRPFFEIIRNKREIITEKMNRVKQHVDHGDIQSAFISMTAKCNGNDNNYIKNIGPSYYTKTLYFLTYFKDLSPQPIIFDYNLHWVNCLLAKDMGEDYHNMYQWHPEYKRGKELDGRRGWDTFGFYNDFCKRMERASKTIGIKSDKLEEFLFSNTIPEGASESPRQYIYNKTKTLFNN